MHAGKGVWLNRLLLPIAMSCVLVGCAATNMTGNINKNLNREFMASKLEITKIDLSAGSKCTGPAAINLINAETRMEQFQILDRGNLVSYVVPSEFVGDLVRYTQERLVESNVGISRDSTKILNLTLDDVRIEGSFAKFAIVAFRVHIPEMNYSKAYRGKDGSSEGVRAVAYAAHQAVTALLMDPVFQQYARCE